jgi:hypothetical protein
METKNGLANPGIKQGSTGAKTGKGVKRKADESLVQEKAKKPKKTKKVDSLFTLASNAFATNLFPKLSTESCGSLLKSINNSNPSDILVDAYSVIIRTLVGDRDWLRARLFDSDDENSKLMYKIDILKEDIDQLLDKNDKLKDELNELLDRTHEFHKGTL